MDPREVGGTSGVSHFLLPKKYAVAGAGTGAGAATPSVSVSESVTVAVAIASIVCRELLSYVM